MNQISNLRKVFNDLAWESKCEGCTDLRSAKWVIEEEDWKFAKRTLARMSEYTPNGTWNHIFFGVYGGVEKLVLVKIKDAL